MIQQRIKNEVIQVEVVDRHKQIEIAEQEIQRLQCELESKIRYPKAVVVLILSMVFFG